MTIASVEMGVVSDRQKTSINGMCLKQEQLTVASATTNTTTLTAAATLAATLTPDGGAMVARVTTDDTGCYVAVGTAPDPQATTATMATSARRWLPAAASLELPIAIGDKVAVRGL